MSKKANTQAIRAVDRLGDAWDDCVQTLAAIDEDKRAYVIGYMKMYWWDKIVDMLLRDVDLVSQERRTLPTMMRRDDCD